MDIVFFVNDMKGDWKRYDQITKRVENWIFSGSDTNTIKEEESYKKWLKRATKKGNKYPLSIDLNIFFDYAKFYGKVNMSYNVRNTEGYKYDKDVGYNPTALLKALDLLNNNLK